MILEFFWTTLYVIVNIVLNVSKTGYILDPPTQSFGWRNVWMVPNRYIIEQKSCFLSLNDIKNSIQFLIFQTHTLWFADYITKDEGLYTVTASNLCGSISYSVIVRILEDEQEYDWMVYRRSKQIVPRTKGFDKFYHTCEEIGRGTQVILFLNNLLMNSVWRFFFWRMTRDACS